VNFLHDLHWVLPLRTPWTVQAAFGLSWLGYATFIMFFMALGYWTWSKHVFYRLMVLITINGLVNAYVKDVFQDPRPDISLRLDDLVGVSYGLPSGHAQMAVAMWLWLAYEVRKPWMWVVCSMIAIGVIFSRLLLGVHDIEDVAVGAILGGASLVMFEWIRRQQWQFLERPTITVPLIAAITCLALVTWPGRAPDYVPLLAGWLAVATCAIPWDRQYIGFQPPEKMVSKIVAALVGALLFMGTQKILKATGTALLWDPLAWSLVKGLVNGLFVSLLIPGVLRSIGFSAAKSSPRSARAA
jgi:membrane-associated phospholipid phosphatase